MRIFQVITLCELGGAQTVVVNLANKLSEQNEVVVIAGEGNGKMWPLLSPAVKIEYCPHLQRAVSPKADFLAAIELRRLYRKYKPDIIHLHSSKAGILGRIVFPTAKVVYTVHGFDSVRIAYRKFLPVERLMQHFCRAVVGVSEYDCRNLISERITKNVCTVYNGIVRPDMRVMQPIPEFKKYAKTILCIARVFPPPKNRLYLLKQPACYLNTVLSGLVTSEILRSLICLRTVILQEIFPMQEPIVRWRICSCYLRIMRGFPWLLSRR